MSEPLTMAGRPLGKGESWPCDPPQPGCRKCTWPFDEGYCPRAAAVVCQPDDDDAVTARAPRPDNGAPTDARSHPNQTGGVS